MKSTKVQNLGADHAIEYLETLDKLMDKICNSNNAQSGVYTEPSVGGFTKSSWGSGGRCKPPSGVRGGAPEKKGIQGIFNPPYCKI